MIRKYVVVALANLLFATSAAAQTPNPSLPIEVNEGPCEPVEIIAGPFDITRKYRSMEGPFAIARFRPGDLLFTGKATLGENKIRFVENGNQPRGMASKATPTAGSAIAGDMTAPSTAHGGGMMVMPPTLGEDLADLVDTSHTPRELLWLKGLKLEVLDENDQPLPTAEFICHANLDLEPKEQNEAFPEGERWLGERLLTLTQGQTSFMLPPGYAVPIASDAHWRFVMQAANRTTDKHRRLKQRATFYFIKDSELVHPVVALHERSNFVAVITDRDTDEATELDLLAYPHCDVPSVGVNAPNNTVGSTYEDKERRKLTGHWVVPPGEHKYSSVMNAHDPELAAKARKMRACWVHVHPLCERVEVIACNGGKHAKPLFTADITTKTEGGLEITSIAPRVPSAGITLPKSANYQLQAHYKNPLAAATDSMVSIGMFMEDKTFVRPDWSLPSYKVATFGGIKPGLDKDGAPVTMPLSGNMLLSVDVKSQTKTDSTVSKNLVSPVGPAGEPATTAVDRIVVTHAGTIKLPPLFDSKVDGPLLDNPTPLTVDTTSGKLHFVLEPNLAPKTATHIAKLFRAGAYDGTRLNRYQPGYIVQVSSAEDKALGASISPELYSLVRRLPLEATTGKAEHPVHRKFALSLAHFEDDENSGMTSFSIMLRDAPHLDGKYTVFGHLDDDAETKQTLERITSDWEAEQPAIVSAK